jgi:MarR-like DNA-binding transcriptional regulator SgrR of sgrS sRNA
VAARQHAGGRPYLNRVEFVGAPDTAATEWSALRIARVLPGDAGLSGAVRVRSTGSRLGFLLVNPQSEVLGSEANRKQLSQSFDRSVFVRIVLGGDGQASEDLLPGALRRIENRGNGSRGNLGSATGTRVRIVVSDGEPVLRALGERLFVHLYALGLTADLVVCPAAEFRGTLAAGRFDVAVLGWTPPQPADEALLATTSLQFFAAGTLQPALGEALPEAWAPARLAAAKDPAAALLRSKLCIPLVFFHDVWQTPAEVLHLEPSKAGVGLGLESVHLEPR